MCVCVCVCVHVCVCVCVCVCEYVEFMHMVSNQALIIYKGFDTLLFYIMLIALKAI